MQDNGVVDQVTMFLKIARSLPKKLSKYRYELIMVVVFATAIWAIAFYTSWKVVPSVIPTFLATFLGVLFSFLLLGCSERRKARKKAVHALALIWLELENNKEIATDIKGNLVFPADAKLDTLEQVMRRTGSLRKCAEELREKSYYATQQSGAFFEIKGDDVYNSINSAYYDLYITRRVFLTAELSFLHFKEAKWKPEEAEKKESDESLKEWVREYLDRCQKETTIFLQDLEGAISRCSRALKRYGITTGEVKRAIGGD